MLRGLLERLGRNVVPGVRVADGGVTGTPKNLIFAATGNITHLS